jgi:hypothetical protein
MTGRSVAWEVGWNVNRYFNGPHALVKTHCFECM